MYAELKCKTNFSFLTGASHPEELIEQAQAIGLKGIAITDTNGVYGIAKAYWKAKDFPDLKFIVGAELKILQHPSLTLLAKTKRGYGWLCKTLTLAHADKEKGCAALTLQELQRQMSEPAAQDIFCLPSEGASYELLIDYFKNNLFIPLSRFLDGHDERRLNTALALQKRWGLPLVATNDVLYHTRARRPLQDAMVAIREKASLLNAGFHLQPNSERVLKSPLEMRILFKDQPVALENTLLIADSCTFSPSELRYRYPSEWIPKNHTAFSYLTELTLNLSKERYNGSPPSDVMAQIHHELKLIEQLGFADYFLTIYDIVHFARSRDILCQGRGSAANSVVCYCLGITAIDPVRMKLLFERFISVERGEPPDIDVDFEHERREEVIQYIYEKYGRHRAAMVSAVVTYKQRLAFRELSKAVGIDIGTLSAKKLIHEFDQHEAKSPLPHCREIIETLSEEMAGFPRHLSIHSGGFTLSADPITEIVPIEPARMPGRTIIQWDKYDLDYLGLLKIDVLALGMLSALQKSLKLVGKKLHELPPEDKATYKMIQHADTVGTFQVESRAQMNMSGRLKPETFYDLVIQVAIVRPGPITGKMVHPYLRRRQGLEPTHYPHPRLREILGRTLGVPLFQEQLMQIAIRLGEFSPGEADQLRRAIGAWRASGSIQKVAERLLQGLRKNGIPEEYAAHILEHMKGFAHYGFPESHAASFALLSYASCYLKRHHPAAFACGLLNSQPMGFYAPHSIVDDAKLHGVQVLPVDPNHSDWECTLEGPGRALRLGLKMIYGLHQKQAAVILEQRPFHSVADFLARTRLPADTLERLAMGQFFNCFGLDQRHTLWSILSDRVHSQTEQLDLFSGQSLDGMGTPSAPLFSALNAFESVTADYTAYGASAVMHPMAALRKVQKLPPLTTAGAKRRPPRTTVRTAGLILVRQKPPTANGVCFSVIEDEHGFLDLVLFKREFEKYKEIFLYQCFLIVTGTIERDGHSVSLIVKKLEPLWQPNAAPLTIEPTQYFW